LNIQQLLIGAQIAVTIVILIYASWRDYKCREVSNRVWAIYAPIAATLSIANLVLFDSSKLLMFAASVGITVALAFLLFYSGGFGGADSKALMCLAVALPFAPQVLSTPITNNSLSPIAEYIFPLTVFSNAVLFAAASAVYMVFRNLVWHRRQGKKMFAGSLAHESVGKKILVLLTGYKVAIGKLKEQWHVFPMEDVKDNGEINIKRKLVVIPHEEGRDGVVERLSNAAGAGKIDSHVWATPGLPMLIFITAGLIVALLFGDMVWLLVKLVIV
jgi:preflagellin peptidase FlaK